PTGDLVYARDAFWSSNQAGIVRFLAADILNDSPGAPAGVDTTFPTAHPPVAVSAGADGSVWFATMETHPGGPATVGRIDLDDNLVQFPVSGQAARPAVAADGSAWTLFAGSTQFVVAHITPSGTMTTCPVPSSLGGEIIIGPDQHIWFTDPGRTRIATFTP